VALTNCHHALLRIVRRCAISVVDTCRGNSKTTTCVCIHDGVTRNERVPKGLTASSLVVIFPGTMLRLLHKLLLSFVLVTAGMLAIAGAANAHAGHGGSAASVHSQQHESHTAVPPGAIAATAAEAGTIAAAPALPCGGHDGTPAMDAGCCAVTCHSVVGAPLVGPLTDLAVERIVPSAAVRTLHGSATGGTERPPRLG
jgi:hypothetical protein